MKKDQLVRVQSLLKHQNISLLGFDYLTVDSKSLFKKKER